MLNGDEFNAYVYYVNRNHVIDAMHFKKSKGRYANDANGISRTKGITNNTRYVVEDKRVFMEATKNIAAGGEILVAYGKEYWDVIRENLKILNKDQVNEE